MAASGVRITGLREVQRGFRKLAAGTAAELRAALAQEAEPVAADARQRLSAYSGASVGTIGPRVVFAGVFVTQRARKVTGLRPDFGALQMRKAMIPALEDHADGIVAGADRALGRFYDSVF